MINHKNLKSLCISLSLTFLCTTNLFSQFKITGTSKICPGDVLDYSLANIPSCILNSCTGADNVTHQDERIFSWSIVGGTILSGQNTANISVSWDNYNNCNGATYEVKIVFTCLKWNLEDDRCVEKRTNTTASLTIEKKCPVILNAEIPELDCCPDPSKQFTLEILTNANTEDLEIEWPTGLEPILPRTVIFDAETKKYTYSITAGSSFLSGTITATAQGCSKKISQVIDYPISRKYKKSKFNSLSSPKALCIGSVGSYCIDFGEPCYNVSYRVLKYSGTGQLLGTTSTVNNGNSPCFSVVSSPVSTSPVDNNQYMIIEATVTAFCNPQGEILTFKVKTPITPPVTSGNSPVPTVPTVICPCRSSFVLLADSSEASDMVEWELTNNPNQTWQTTALKCITCEFQPNFCSQFLFGVHQVTGPFQDITVRYRRHNICGWGPWMQTVIPASYFYPDGSSQCPLTN